MSDFPREPLTREPLSGPRKPHASAPAPSSGAPRAAPRRRTKAAGRLRPVGFDDLGLKRALSDRLLPFLVAAMAFLAALALAGAMATAMLAQHWQQGAEAELTVQVPTPDQPAASGHGARLAAVLTILRAQPGVISAKPMSSDDLATLLKPWLGDAGSALALPLPAVIAVTLAPGSAMPADLAAKLQAVAPDTATESADIWAARLSALARSLQACAAVMLLLVVGVAIAVVTVATRAGLSARRDAIEIVHGLGATDAYIAGRFARRAMRLAAAGGVGGALAALPVLLWLAYLAAPFAQGNAAVTDQTPLIALPLPLWFVLPALPLAAAAIGYVTAEGTVRRWLRRLP